MTLVNGINSQSQPSLCSYLSPAVTNKTGDGTVATVVYDNIIDGGNLNISTGIFTATRSAYFTFRATIIFGTLSSSHKSSQLTLVTTGGSYVLEKTNAGFCRASDNSFFTGGFITGVWMNNNDTASITIAVSGGTKVVGFNGSSIYTYFSVRAIP